MEKKKKVLPLAIVGLISVVVLALGLGLGLGLGLKSDSGSSKVVDTTNTDTTTNNTTTTTTTCDTSLTCGDCAEEGCKVALCSSEVTVTLGSKSDFWPPETIWQRSSGPHPLPPNVTAEYDWFQKTVLDSYPKPTKQEDTEYALTEQETTLVKMGLSEWIEARAAGTYTCLDMATALTKRARYLQNVQSLNHFMYWSSFDWVSVVLAEAEERDDFAGYEGTNSVLAPLYCYPIPLPGTLATKDFPSSLGLAALYDKFAVEDAALTTLLKRANAASLGKTNTAEMAHSAVVAGGGATGNYHDGLCLSPWNYDEMSAGGSGAAVASYAAAVAIVDDGSTAAAGHHLFGYDPPKFHYPNLGNLALTVRNDQLGVNARSVDDVIALDQAVLGNERAHDDARAWVERRSNANITIGCSDVYYDYDAVTTAIRNKFERAMEILEEAGFHLLRDNCQQDDAAVEVVPDTTTADAPPYAVWFHELETYIHETLGLVDVNPWDVLLNGFYDFGSSLSSGWMYDYVTEGCSLTDQDTEQLRRDYLGPVPLERAKVYNKYFDEHRVDLLVGPAQICDRILWSDDLAGGCDGGNIQSDRGGGCMYKCYTAGVTGARGDKTFTKAKFVVPIGLTEAGEHFSLHFMSRAGPYDTTTANTNNPTPLNDDWIYDQDGPRTWNLEELYMIQRIADTLATAGLKRADATMNFVSGLLSTSVS